MDGWRNCKKTHLSTKKKWRVLFIALPKTFYIPLKITYLFTPRNEMKRIQDKMRFAEAIFQRCEIWRWTRSPGCSSTNIYLGISIFVNTLLCLRWNNLQAVLKTRKKQGLSQVCQRQVFHCKNIICCFVTNILQRIFLKEEGRSSI